MKAERTEPVQKFVPVIVTLESQEEVDSLYIISNYATINRILPALNGWCKQLGPFASYRKQMLWDDLNAVLR